MAKIYCLLPDKETEKMVQVSLEHAGHSVKLFLTSTDLISSCTTNGNQQANDCDLVIIDHSPPENDGLSIFLKLISQNPNLRVLLLSSDRSLETVMAAIKGGVMGYLRKPTEPDVLVQVVEEALTKIPTKHTSVSTDQLFEVMGRPTHNGFHAALVEAHRDDKSCGWHVKFDVDSPDGSATEVIVDLPSYTVEFAKAITDCEKVPGNERFWVAMAEEALASHLSAGEMIPENGHLIVDKIDTDLKRWLNAVLTVR